MHAATPLRGVWRRPLLGADWRAMAFQGAAGGCPRAVGSVLLSSPPGHRMPAKAKPRTTRRGYPPPTVNDPPLLRVLIARATPVGKNLMTFGLQANEVLPS